MEGNYMAVSGTYLDPISNVIANPNLMTAAGGAIGYYLNKDKPIKKMLMYSALWAVGARFMPIPALAAAGYFLYKKHKG